MKNLIRKMTTLIIIVSAAAQLDAQSVKIDSIYEFKTKVDLKTTSVKDQYKSGTCWSFSGISFIESELLRMGKGEYDLSEMYIVNRDYHNRAIDYVIWNGSKKFGSGSEGGNVFNRIREYGIMPQSAYSGLNYGSDKHMNNEMDAVLKNYVEAIIQNPNGKLSTAWINGFDAVLDSYLGTIPESFVYEGAKYTPTEFRDALGINPDDYIELTSFSHHPLYSKFIMEVEDNWELCEVYNVSIDELTNLAFGALDKGYTLLWGGDVSELGFSWRNGIAIVPADEDEDMAGTDRERLNQSSKSIDKHPNLFKQIVPEIEITPENRQAAFDNYETTDDHGMHITGYLTDKNGIRYFKVKNSWNDSNIFNGYIYMSETFFRYKTLTLIVHKDAVPNSLKKKLKL
mgnify:CR=1 FL=1